MVIDSMRDSQEAGVLP